MTLIRFAIGAGAALAMAAPAASQERAGPLEPPFTVWDVTLGAAVAELPDLDVNNIACGTDGGPQGRPLASFTDFADCPAAESGLAEVIFTYDDELDYVARAMELEYAVLQDGTSVFAHAILPSVLIDADGVVRGLRILTDPGVPDRDRRRAVTLMRNFTARYTEWGLDCRDLPLADGEMPVGTGFTKRTCTGTSPDGTRNIRLDSRYLRKQGQSAVNRETRAVNSSYFESFTRLEIVEAPLEPSPPAVLER